VTSPGIDNSPLAMYGNHMPAELAKTTVYLPAADYRRLQAIARERGESAASLIREAVAVYTAQHRPEVAPRSIGLGRSRSHNLSERAETLLKGMGKSR
jgi:hypothetical protein